ncbi:MAG: lytic transglycosylase domain-containing protein [Thermoanaerobacteraceae bacterium]|nr:lytic transglycosylase domain-containing protein [Thermoanaerobacteraceae bacterium]
MNKVKLGTVALLTVSMLLLSAVKTSNDIYFVPAKEALQQPCITEPKAVTIEAISEEVEQVPTMYDIPLDTELQSYTYDLCVEYSIEEYYPLILAVMWHESNFNEKAVSETNDYGLMQINKINHKWLSEKFGITDFLDAKQNIKAGVYILSTYLLKYEDIDKALMAYNLGETGARRCWSAGKYTTKYVQLTRERLEQLQYKVK